MWVEDPQHQRKRRNNNNNKKKEEETITTTRKKEKEKKKTEISVEPIRAIHKLLTALQVWPTVEGHQKESYIGKVITWSIFHLSRPP